MTDKMNILIVDDDKFLSEVHKGILEEAGHQVTVPDIGQRSISPDREYTTRLYSL